MSWGGDLGCHKKGSRYHKKGVRNIIGGFGVSQGGSMIHRGQRYHEEGGEVQIREFVVKREGNSRPWGHG